MAKALKEQDIWVLLQKIDTGYEPNAEERAALESCVSLTMRLNVPDKLPKSIGQLSALEELSLRGTKLTELPETIGQLGALRYLNLRITNLTKLPDTIGQLGSLERLYLDNTELAELPETIGQLGALEKLALSYTNLTKLPETIGQLGTLKHVSLRGAKLIELPETIGQLGALEFIDLSNTSIAKLPETIGQLGVLEALDLSGTELTELPETIGQLGALKRLYLSNTPITEIPETIGRLSKLESLNLSWLKLKRIPRSLTEFGLPFISKNWLWDERGINLHNTVLEEQNISIFLESPELIPSLYKESELTEVRECKVIFLGDGRAGKSYTIKRIKNGDRKGDYKTDETHGVEISEHKFSKQGYTINFWDFGGQDIQHSMHRCFLTSDTCYVVTVNSRDPNGTSRAAYWLRNAAEFAPNSHVLLYINLWGKDKNAGHIDESKLRAEFENIVDVVYCSAEAAEADEFNGKVTDGIARMVDASYYCERKVNSRWIMSAQAIRRENQGVITKERYSDICTENGIEDQEAPALLTFFNNLGVCFSYHMDEQRRELEQYRLLDPKWLTNAVYAVILEAKIHAHEGWINYGTVESILCSEKRPDELKNRVDKKLVYDKDELPYIIDVAVKFNLCYKEDEPGERLFFPALCESNSPAEALRNFNDYSKNAKYVFRYKYLPDSVVHKLMVRCYKKDMAVNVCWLKGMVLGMLGQIKAVIQMDDDDKTLRIDIYSTEQRPACELFPHIRNEILAINRELNISAEEYIVKGEDEFFVARLIKSYRNNKKTVEGSRTGDEYDPFELLAGVYDIFSIACLEEREGKLITRECRFHERDKNKKADSFRQALWEAYGEKCVYCGRELSSLDDMQVDHILPTEFAKQLKNADGRSKSYIKRLEAQGFNLDKPDYIENYFPCCGRDNCKKRNKIMTADSMCFYHEEAFRKTPDVLNRMDILNRSMEKGREELKKR